MANECDYCDTKEIKREVIENGITKTFSNLKTIGNDTICNDCLLKGVKAKSVTTNDAPININEVLTKTREVDARIKVNTDLFNAETVSIVEIKKAIDENAAITNKPYALAVALQERYGKYKQVIFEHNQEIMNASNKQKAIQVYLNNLANQLRADEREKLKINDINYQVSPVSNRKVSLATGNVTKVAKKKLDKAEVRKYAALLMLPEFTLQMICIQKNLSAEDGYNMLKKSIDEAKAQIPVVQNSDQVENS
jgi:hypothetical protein